MAVPMTPERPDWVIGDLTRLSMPAHPRALADGGAAFLTRAFHAAGSLPPENRVARVDALTDCPGGSTGAKLFLSIAYERPAPDLPTALFVKFSRDFNDPIRDRNRDQLAPEVRFANLSRHPAFPIAVPRTLFGDYQAVTGTGLLITERIGFGVAGIEPHRDKCLDYLMPDAIGHYRVLVAALARLAGASRTAPLAGPVAEAFPFVADTVAAIDPIRYEGAQLRRRIEKLASFARAFPRLLPARITSPGFLCWLWLDMPTFAMRQEAIRRLLIHDTAHIALCHWNGNIDNAWFWRDADGALRCGLMDWGRVGQMHVGMALWGVLSAAEPAMIEGHLDELLFLFAAEFAAAGGGEIQVETLRNRMFLYIAMMGLAWLMDAPALIRRELPDLAPDALRTDACFQQNETARTQLHMLTNFLMLWERYRFGHLLADVP